jgi:hypothetical protein
MRPAGAGATFQRFSPCSCTGLDRIQNTVRASARRRVALPRLRVVGDPREPPTQLDSGRQLSLLIDGRADRSGIGLGDNEHLGSMAARAAAGKTRRYTALMRDASGKARGQIALSRILTGQMQCMEPY